MPSTPPAMLVTTAIIGSMVLIRCSSPVGKTLRFATDGSVSPDNPRADHTWTWGHRNSQGLAMLPNGAVVNTEHGQWMFQSNEINLLQANEDHSYPYYVTG
ncbi:MAG: PQQ-dependent sugar dehydrogenase [Flavobacteriales bacterium]|nr:PQQ-dependent sugar dehydrogenase [Flavobacteriales bacterium]